MTALEQYLGGLSDKRVGVIGAGVSNMPLIRMLRASGVPCEVTGKIHEGASSVVDAIAAGEISLMINTPLGVATRDDGYELRRAAVRHGITYATTLAAAQALIAGMQAARAGELDVAPLQEL